MKVENARMTYIVKRGKYLWNKERLKCLRYSHRTVCGCIVVISEEDEINMKMDFFLCYQQYLKSTRMLYMLEVVATACDTITFFLMICILLLVANKQMCLSDMANKT